MNNPEHEALKKALTSLKIKEKYASDMKNVENFDTEHSEKVMYHKMINDVVINFNRINNLIEGLLAVRLSFGKRFFDLALIRCRPCLFQSRSKFPLFPLFSKFQYYA